MAVDWSELEADLIGEIAKNICNVEDFAVFSLVCPSWRLSAVKENWVSDDRQFPWLVVTETNLMWNGASFFDQQNRRAFFNFKNNKRYEYDLDVSNLQDCRVFGCDHGWIFAFDEYLDMHLIKPLARLRLSLPHYTTFKHLPLDLESIWHRFYFICEAIVFIRNNKLHVAAIIRAEFNYLVIAQPGDPSWTEVEFESRHKPPVESMVSCNGQLFALGADGVLYICQFDGPEETPKLIIIAATPPIAAPFINNPKIYVVESMGSILMVARHVGVDDECDYKTFHFDVYEMNFKNNKWVKRDSLGERALFVGDSYSMSLSSAKVSACEGNSIYFTDDSIDGQFCGGHDMGVYSLEKRDIHPLPFNLDSQHLCSSFSCPVWMMPSLFY